VEIPFREPQGGPDDPSRNPSSRSQTSPTGGFSSLCLDSHCWLSLPGLSVTRTHAQGRLSITEGIFSLGKLQNRRWRKQVLTSEPIRYLPTIEALPRPVRSEYRLD
jgi:hypothetical protein